jgi:phosphoribosyl 1,2-cyclic phosphodiesterase
VDHVAGLAVLARKLGVPVYFTEPTHRAWVRMLTPRTTMTYAKWLDQLAAEKARKLAEEEQIQRLSREGAEVSQRDTEVLERVCAQRSEDRDAVELPVDPDAESEPVGKVKADPAFLPSVQYFRAGHRFSIGDLEICPFTIPHDAADPCGFVFESEGIRMALATDLGYVPPNVKAALKRIDVLLLESNHDLEMLRDGPYPWSVKQRVLSRVGHLSNEATAEFLQRDYDGGAAYIVLGHLSESNNAPELARITAERAIGDRMTLLGNRVLLAMQSEPLAPICL